MAIAVNIRSNARFPTTRSFRVKLTIDPKATDILTPVGLVNVDVIPGTPTTVPATLTAPIARVSARAVNIVATMQDDKVFTSAAFRVMRAETPLRFGQVCGTKP